MGRDGDLLCDARITNERANREQNKRSKAIAATTAPIKAQHIGIAENGGEITSNGTTVA